MAEVKPLQQVAVQVAARFDHRISWLFCACLAGFAAMLSGQFLFAPSSSLWLHLATASIAALIFLGWQGRDGWRLVFYGAPFLTFTFTLFLNASLRGLPVDHNLLAPDRAAMLVLISQAAVGLVSWLDLWVEARRDSLPRVAVPPDPNHLDPDSPNPGSFDPASAAPDRLSQSFRLLLALSLIVLALRFTGGLPTVVSKSFFYVIPLCVTYHFLRQLADGQPGVHWHAPVFLVFFVGYGVLAFVDNNRTDLLSFALLAAVLLAQFSDRLLTVARCVAGYIGLKLLQIFSDVSLAVRPLRANPDLMLAEALQRFFSAETLRTLINPWHAHSAETVYAARQTGHSYFTAPFFDGPVSSLIDRLTLLPQMDIVTGRSAAPAQVDWASLWQVSVPSALPDFGQAKILMLGDQIVWDLALRSRDSIGRPMITSQAEAWALGGLWAVFLTGFAIFLGWALTYRLLLWYFQLRPLVQGFMAVVAVHALFTTTLLEQVLAMIRFPLQVLVLLSLCGLLARLITPLASLIRSAPTGEGAV